jgi:hypothetical protein
MSARIQPSLPIYVVSLRPMSILTGVTKVYMNKMY